MMIDLIVQLATSGSWRLLASSVVASAGGLLIGVGIGGANGLVFGLMTFVGLLVIGLFWEYSHSEEHSRRQDIGAASKNDDYDPY